MKLKVIDKPDNCSFLVVEFNILFQINLFKNIDETFTFQKKNEYH